MQLIINSTNVDFWLSYNKGTQLVTLASMPGLPLHCNHGWCAHDKLEGRHDKDKFKVAAAAAAYPSQLCEVLAT